MKKIINLLFATMIAFSFTFVSCGDDDKDTGNTVDDILGYSYSNLSPEKQKEKLQNDAISFLNEIKGVNEEQGVMVLAAFSELLSIDAPEGLNSSNDLVYTELYGKYTWNGTTNKWTKSTLNDQAEFTFPLGAGVDGKIVVTPTSPVNVATGATQTIRVPKNVTVGIYLGTTEVSSIKASSEIQNATTIPANSNLSYKLGKYDLSFSAVKGGNNAVTGILKKGDNILIDASLNTSGDLDNLLLEENPGNINGNVLIKLNNTLAFAGAVNVTKYAEAMGKAEQDYDDATEKGMYYSAEAEEKFAKAETKAFNDSFELYLVSLSDNTKIARLKAETKSETYYSSTYWYSEYVLGFGDGTTSDVDAYFGSGFEKFQNQFNEFISMSE
jgi:hypothetical protein